VTEFTGIVFKTGQPNKNGRIYTPGVTDRAIAEYQKNIDNKSAIGEFGELGQSNSNVVSLEHASHRIKEMWIPKNRLPRKKKKLYKKLGKYQEWKRNCKCVMATIEIVDTPGGKSLKALLNAKIKPQLAVRGVGSVNSNGIVGEDFKLISIDAVSESATFKKR